VCGQGGRSIVREVHSVLGVGRSRLAVSLHPLERWGIVVSAAAVAALATDAAAAAAEVRALASIARLAVGDTGV